MNQRSWSFDQTGILRDRNLAFPLDRLREMQEHGEIATLAPRCYSFMGSIVGPAQLMKESAPEVARRLTEDHVDVALLTPLLFQYLVYPIPPVYLSSPKGKRIT